MFAEVRRRGWVIDDSRFEEWQKYGVMPKGRKESRGRKGVAGWWSRHQLEWLCTLCKIRKEQGVRLLAPQCNLPVWVWMYWGEEYGVSLDQVKRAMKTWVRRRYPAPSKETRASARHLVSLVANGEIYGTRQAQQQVIDWLQSKDGSLRELADGLAYAYDSTQAANGPSDARLTPELIAQHIKAQLLGLEALNSGHEFPDQWWWWARHIHLHGVADFLIHQGRYARETAGTPAKALYTMETIQQLCLSACQDLVIGLGLGLLLSEEQARLPEMLDLEMWLKQVTSARISAHMEPSPLWLPNGMRSGTLHIGEEVAVGSPGGPH